MANEVYNSLSIIGRRSAVLAALHVLGITDLSADEHPNFADVLVPYPAKMRQQEEEYEQLVQAPDRAAALATYRLRWGVDADAFNGDSEQWIEEHWGSKWGAAEISLEGGARGPVQTLEGSDDETITYQIEYVTAWKPLHPQVFLPLVERVPEVRLEIAYSEPNTRIEGEYKVSREFGVHDELSQAPDDEEDEEEERALLN